MTDKTNSLILFRNYCRIIVLLVVIPIPPSVLAAPIDKIRFGIHPYLPKEELHKRFSPLIEFLSKELKLSMELVVSKNYESHIENIGNNVVDIAYMGPSSFVELSEKYGRYPLLARLEIKGKPVFHGYIVARNDTQITKLKQLRGKRFAFGSPHSTMSYLVPRYMLKESGVRLEALKNYNFLGNHRNVALGVLLGEYDAGAVKEEIYFELKERGLRHIAISPAISEHLFVCSKNMPARLCNQIGTTMQNLSQIDKGRNILSHIKKGLTGFVPAKHSDYDNLRVIMR